MKSRGIILATICALAAAPSCSSGSGDATGSGDDAGLDGTASSSGGSGSSSGGGSGGSSGGGSGGSSGGGSGGSSGGTTGDGGTCLGSSMLATLGKNHLLVGGTMSATTAKLAPFDLQYVYVSGGLQDGTGPCASCASGCTAKGTTCANSGPGCAWWGCWQYDQVAPGDYLRGFDTTWTTASPAQIPMVTYYQLLQSSGVTEGAPEVTQAATNQAFMARYLADWRFLLQQIGMTTALLHIEPDFWGYAEQYAVTAGGDPTTLPAAVASANPTDCASQPNTIAGMGKCMIAMVRKYSPHALVALHASAWSTNMDVTGNSNPSFDVAGEARKTATFLAASGESDADFVVVETSDRDAGYYTCQGRATWWDATNATLPNFHQDFAWVKALTEALSKPALWWQTPLGNMNVANVCPEPTSGTITWHDNRVDYFMAHMDELAAAHGVGAAFGAGQGDQTTPDDDGGNLVTKAKAYFAAGGQALCK